MSKLKANPVLINEGLGFFYGYAQFEIDKEIVEKAFQLCKEINSYSNINDAVHLQYAEKYCQKIMTYDRDFNKFKKHSDIQIEILT